VWWIQQFIHMWLWTALQRPCDDRRDEGRANGERTSSRSRSAVSSYGWYYRILIINGRVHEAGPEWTRWVHLSGIGYIGVLYELSCCITFLSNEFKNTLLKPAFLFYHMITNIP